MTDLALELDTDGRIAACDDAFEGFLGGDGGVRVLGRRLDALTVGRSRRTIERARADAHATGELVGPVDCWFSRTRGSVAAARLWLVATSDGRTNVRGQDLATADPDVRAGAVELLLRDRAAEDDPSGSVLVDLAQLVEWSLPGTTVTIGVTEDDLVRHRFAPSLSEQVIDALEGQRPAAGGSAPADGLALRPLTALCPDLDSTSSQVVAVALDDDDGTVLGELVLLVTEGWTLDRAGVRVVRAAADAATVVLARNRRERQLRWSSRHDALTGLPNRDLVLDRLQIALTRSRRSAHDTAVLIIDLDEFKVVNDSLGHEAGDDVLTSVAEVLGDVRRAGETTGRLGADEFLMVIAVDTVDEALARAEEVRVALDSVVPAGGVHVRTRASIGVVVAGRDDDPAGLVRDAGAALHRAKDDGRDRVCLFDESLRQGVLDRVALEAELRHALARDEVEVHYQPVVDVASMVAVSLESLVRWRREGTDELVAPDLFVPTAEDVGLIADIGAEVLRQAVDTVAWLRSQGLASITVAVNVSPHQLGPDFVELVAATLERAQVPSESIVLEITERTLLWKGAGDVISALSGLGVSIAIDDFGTGYSGLNHLRSYPTADSVKIDGSFVADVEGPTPSGQMIVAAAVALGHGLGMTVVAEGVETEGQLQFLRELGCDRVQGYLLSPPLVRDDLVRGLAALGTHTVPA